MVIFSLFEEYLLVNQSVVLSEAADAAAMETARALLARRFGPVPRAYVHAFGCQQNVSDAERIRGVLARVGFDFVTEVEQADLILLHTCAVRESAEDRVLGNVGALKSLKRRRPELLIALGGCMTQRPEMAERLRTSFPYVDIVFGTGAVHRLPEMLRDRLSGGRVFWSQSAPGAVEGVPVRRDEGVKAWLPIMQGCDNFCSYCIVPHVRGREASRAPDEVEREAREILAQGYREITLLGQNVNSYGKGLQEKVDFSALVRRLDAIEGEHRLRFMTSHPKDCTPRLLETLSQTSRFCRHIHLPVQSGSDRVLREMNRGYTVERYLSLIDRARELLPGATFSSDIIVGFPGETRADFEATLELVKKVRYNALFTFLYSRRSGTAAAEMEDPVPAGEKSVWFRELLRVQQDICCELNGALVGRTLRVLVDSRGKSPGRVAGRTEGNVIVELEGPSELIGRFVDVVVTGARSWALLGRVSGSPIA